MQMQFAVRSLWQLAHLILGRQQYGQCCKHAGSLLCVSVWQKVVARFVQKQLVQLCRNCMHQPRQRLSFAAS